MPWANESAFRSVLSKIGRKATQERLKKIAELAVADEEYHVKHACAMVLKEMKNLKPQYK